MPMWARLRTIRFALRVGAWARAAGRTDQGSSTAEQIRGPPRQAPRVALQVRRVRDGQSTRSRARAAASPRLATPSLPSRFDTCTLTVFSLMNRSAAIVLLVAPVARRSRTSRSRGVSRLTVPRVMPHSAKARGCGWRAGVHGVRDRAHPCRGRCASTRRAARGPRPCPRGRAAPRPGSGAVRGRSRHRTDSPGRSLPGTGRPPTRRRPWRRTPRRARAGRRGTRDATPR